MERPITCQNKDCDCTATTCAICINRNAIAKKGYELCQIIEQIPASEEQTKGIIAVEAFIQFVENEYKRARDNA